MDVKFSFEDAGENLFGKIYRPLAKVSFQSPKDVSRWSDTWMIVDTGADFSILPRYVAKDLGIDLKKDCIKNTTAGVGGEQTIHLLLVKITARIGHIVRKVPVAFFDRDDMPPLLGRLGFLEMFDTEFLKSHVVIFKE